MKIAIATENGCVAQHFGRCPEYTIVEIEGSGIGSKAVEENPGHAPGAIPQFLSGKGCEVIIAGGMGQRAQMFFQEYNIECIIGVQGDVEKVIEDYINGSLESGESTCVRGDGKGDGTGRDNGCEH